jgi:ATP synthase protein I
MTSDPTHREHTRHEAAFFAAAAVPAALATVVAGVVGAFAGGMEAAVGAVLGGLLVIAFFGADHVLSARTRRSATVAVTGLVMATYAAKLAVLAAVLVVFRDTELFSSTALAVSVVVVTGVWIAAHVRAFARRRMLYVDSAGEGGGAL